MSDLVTLGSTYRYLSDYMDVAGQTDEKGFCSQIRAPLLISAKRPKSASFSQGATRAAVADQGKYLPTHLIEYSHKLPVYEIRHQSAATKGRIVLGRSPDNEVVIPDDTVSLMQCIFIVDEQTGRCSIEDMDSKNGTFVNKERLEFETLRELEDGDTIAFGDQYLMFFYPKGLFGILKASLSP